ncbi:preprotein translocase subunit SecG [Clostridium punense]|uniref:Preprotein translocase subunit SecG n=1 Tax=Clostridium punense TaxID=1054297 RepID=A0ABS4K665_9CLOT|nr:MULTISPECIES: hypothetical protein [Clostridium]EQB87995.1 hypothetical protein M918_06275 [Clostridium sp. BL8]MBP2023276.1 preprotein translocase subunit SecG [Clostridium punense]
MKRNNIRVFAYYILFNLLTLLVIIPIDYRQASLPKAIGVFIFTIVLYMVLGKFLTKQHSHSRNLLSISSIFFFNLLIWVSGLFPDKRGLPELLIPFANNGFFCFFHQYLMPKIINDVGYYWKISAVIVTFLPTFVLWLALEKFGRNESQTIDKTEKKENNHIGIKRFLVKKTTRAIGFFIIVVFLLSIMLNPQQGSFNHWFMENARWTLSDKVLVNDIEDAVMSDMHGKAKVIKRSNRIVYSVFTIPDGSGKAYKYLGIMGRFVRID